MVAGIPKHNLSINALDILLGKYRIQGSSSGTPDRLRAAIEFSHKHSIKPHLRVFHSLDDIHEMIDIMSKGATGGRCAVVFGSDKDVVDEKWPC